MPILIIFLAIFVMYCIMSSNVQVEHWDGTSYSEEAFQDYANEQYMELFGDSSAYEDNLLIVFLVSDDYYSYNYIAWVGDHIATDINYMLGNNDTELGQAMSECINQSNYKYSLDSNLSVVMDSMRKQILDLGLESSYACDENHVQVQSRLVNYSQLSMTEDTVNSALERFTEETGIPVAIVVEDMEDVFGSSVTVKDSASSGSGISVLLIIVAVALVVVLIYFISRRKKKSSDDFVQEEKNREYRKFDDQY